jgi:hypothetical protein
VSNEKVSEQKYKRASYILRNVEKFTMKKSEACRISYKQLPCLLITQKRKCQVINYKTPMTNYKPARLVGENINVHIYLARGTDGYVNGLLEKELPR